MPSRTLPTIHTAARVLYPLVRPSRSPRRSTPSTPRAVAIATIAAVLLSLSAVDGTAAIAAPVGVQPVTPATPGAVVGWGDNGYGRTDAPAVLTGVIAIAAGNSHSLAIGQLAPIFTADAPSSSVEAGASFPTYTFEASGVPTAMTFTINSGALPAGITLSSAGVLSGTTTTASTYTYTYTVTASNGVSPDATSASHTIEVTAGEFAAVTATRQGHGRCRWNAGVHCHRG